MQLRLLGQITFNQQPLNIPRKSRAILSYIAVSETPRHREELTDLFCSHTEDPRRSLRTLLSRIRSRAPSLVKSQKNHVVLHETAWVDCHQLATVVKQPEIPFPMLVDLYRGEFMAGETLPDCPEFEMWMLGKRVYYRSLYEQALLDLAQRHFEHGAMEPAQAIALQLIESNPYQEEAQMLLIQVLAAQSQYVKAREYAGRFQNMVEQEIGVPPTEAFQTFLASTLPAERKGPGQEKRPKTPTPAQDPFQGKLLLLSPEQLQQRLGGDVTQEKWSTLYDWALETAETAARLWAYQDAAAALEAAIVAAGKMERPPEELAVILARLVLLGRYVNESVSVQEERLSQAKSLFHKQGEKKLPPIVELAEATHLYRVGRYGPAGETAEKAARRFEADRDFPRAGQARTVQGQSLLRAGRNNRADEVLKSVQRWLDEAGDIETLGLNIGETAWVAINRGRIEDAFTIVKAGLRSLESFPSPAAEARLYYTLAACWNHYYDAMGMEHAALEATRRYEQIGNQALAVRCEIYLLQAERYRFRTEAAQKRLGILLQKSYRHHDTWLTAWVMALLGQAAFRKGRLEEAENWYSQAYGLRQQTGERQNQVYDLTWTGRLRAAQGRKQSALHYTTTAVRLMEQAAREFIPWEPWDMYLAHAEVLAQNGRGNQAMSVLEAAYQILQTFSSQIPDESIRNQVLAFEHSKYLLQAWESGQIIPFHKQPHQLI